MRYFVITVCLGSFVLLASVCFAEKFPYRSEYPDVTTIELEDLKSGYDRGEVVLIDLRSTTEFEVIHIKNAINLPYAGARFTRQLKSITKNFPGKKVVVYDNGITCIKSYRAAEDAFDEMIENVYAYDGGVSAWARNYPSETLLLGLEIKDPSTQLISDQQIQDRCIDFADFKTLAATDMAFVLDIRDPIQRTKKLQGVGNAIPVSVDKIVRNIISKGHMKNRQLLIFDQVGTQVKWLMYHLVDNGYKNFYFLDGGATSVLKVQDYRVATIH